MIKDQYIQVNFISIYQQETEREIFKNLILKASKILNIKGEVQQMQELYMENYEMLPREMKEYLNK